MASPTTDDNQRAAVRRRRRVAVVGGGVSGLAAAYKLKVHGMNVTVFEADERAGGKLRSISQDGLIWDEGANTMTESEADVTSLLDNLELRDKQQFPISQHKRYIVRNGKPILIPSNPIALIRSSFLSPQSKFQILLEPFLWKKNNSSGTEESVGGFFQRHFGKEVVEYLIDPVVAGTSGSDPESLSMHHAFPELWDLEKRYGSIISGAVQSMLSAKGGKKSPSGNSKRRRGSFSFFGGMQTLTNALCKEVGQPELNLQSKVLEMSYSCSDNSGIGNWSIFCAPVQNKQLDQQSFDAVIMTAPLGNVKEMKITKRGRPFLLNFIPEVSYMPVSVIISTFKKENVKRPLEGFGVLVPAKEQENGLKTLGTLFSSMMFPDRAHNDLYLYTTFVGGSRNKELAKASREELKEIVTCDLRQLVGAEGEPNFLTHYYWSKAFPLYGREYGSVLEAIDKMEKELPGYFYAGNHKGGISVGKAISSGCKAAQSVISYLDSYSPRKTVMLQHTVPKVTGDSALTKNSSEVIANARNISEASELGTQVASSCRVFSMEDLTEATGNFDQSAFLGEGSIGKLYKGRLQGGGYVAIRSLSLFKRYSIRNLKVRLDLLSKLRHPHLVSFLGYCIHDGGVEDSTSSKIFLVYEYISNGNFRAFLSENGPERILKWSDRLAVLIGVAKAVHFLHTGVIPASSSNRLKTNNILLDDYRIAKLSDYGMSVITGELEQLEAKGDGPKSWHLKKLADDVYDFGFVLLEALVGPIVSGKGEAFLLNEMKSFGSQDGRQRIVDPVVLTTCCQESLSIVISITNKCISTEATKRPSFEDVLWNLQYAAQVQTTADLDQKAEGAL